MLEIGKNSYITLEYANEHVRSRYRGNTKDRKRWEDLAEEDKEILLINACDELESLPWQGRKALSEQELSFPRLPLQYGKVEEGAPLRVKQAQAELALWLSDDDKQERHTTRRELQSQGVDSFSIGDLSESYGNVTEEKPTALVCQKVSVLLSPYLSGGYEIC